LPDDRGHPRRRHRAFFGDDIPQVLALDVLHDNERLAVFRFVNVVHRAPHWVLELPRQDGLLLETLDELLIARQGRRNHLQRAQLLEVHVQRFVHRAHGPLADLLNDLVFSTDQLPSAHSSDWMRGVPSWGQLAK